MSARHFFGALLRPPAILAFYASSFIFKTPRARIIVYDTSGRILLVKTWLSGGKWEVPGGGAKRGELVRKAACRELSEETGLNVKDKALQHQFSLRLGSHEETVFLCRLTSENDLLKPVKQLEVEQADWFDLDALPELSRLTKQILHKRNTSI